MKHRLLLIFLLLVASSYVMAQNINVVENDVAFRQRMRSIVAEGNHQYARSNRTGILAAADELSNCLSARRSAGKLGQGDYLEFLADIYKLRGDWHYENSSYDEKSYVTAEDFFLSALKVYVDNGDVFGQDLDKIPMIRRELAQLYYKQARYREAYDNICFALSAFDNAFLNREFIQGDDLYQEWLDIQIQKALCLARIGNSTEAETIVNQLIERFEKGSEKYYESIRKKAKIIMLSNEPDRSERALPLYRTFYDWRKKDAISTLTNMTPAGRQDYWMRMRPFVTDCFQLEGEDPGFLFDVALFSKGLLLQMNALDRNPKAVKTLDYTWKDVQKSLPSDGCAIEFIQYEKNGVEMLGAVVVRKKGLPIWTNLMSPDDFLQFKTGNRTNEDRVYSSSSSVKNALYQDSVLNEKIWNEELRCAIGESQKIYFSPDGYIHQLAIEYMLPASLADKKFYRLSSPRQIILKRKTSLDSALIVGGLTYLTEVPTVPEGNDALAYDYLNGAHAYFSHLSGTKDEAEQIFAARNNQRDTLIMGDAATEPIIRDLIGQYSIVNLSTHGFFSAAGIPQGTDLKPCVTDESLSQSSLALSGANKSLWNFSFDTSNQDGILSAAELATLDLSKVDLAVISACQTALGRITADGVYGIQRGLKDAGAGAMLVSLWSVSDKATAAMMARFHKNLAGGMDMHDAFFAARQSLIDKNAEDSPSIKVRKFNPRTMSVQYVSETEEYSEPQYYDAFILIDAI